MNRQRRFGASDRMSIETSARAPRHGLRLPDGRSRRGHRPRVQRGIESQADPGPVPCPGGGRLSQLTGPRSTGSGHRTWPSRQTSSPPSTARCPSSRHRSARSGRCRRRRSCARGSHVVRRSGSRIGCSKRCARVPAPVFPHDERRTSTSSSRGQVARSEPPSASVTRMLERRLGTSQADRLDSGMRRLYSRPFRP